MVIKNSFHFRDVFIDPDVKPKNKIISESNLEYIFNFDENALVGIYLQLNRLYFSVCGQHLTYKS
jgi:hypothetical protein